MPPKLFAEALKRATDVLNTASEPGIIVIGDDRDTEKRPNGNSSGERMTVHLSDYQIVAVDDLMAKVMCVFEIVLPSVVASDWESDQRQLCVEVNGESGTCQKASVFNEFSTIDIQVEWGIELDIMAYVIGFEGSKTFAYIKVERPTRALEISTITHVGKPKMGIFR